MASTGATPAVAGLVGRERECAAIDALVEASTEARIHSKRKSAIMAVTKSA